MNTLGYYKKGLHLFKENPPIITMTILWVVWKLLLWQMSLWNINTYPNLQTFLGLLFVLILFLVYNFVFVAVGGITSKFLLKEPVNLETAWEIGKKYIWELVPISMISIFLLIILINIVDIISALILNFFNIDPVIVKLGYDVLFVSWILGLFFIFVVPAIVIGQNTAMQAIKKSVKLVKNNKIKAIILASSLTLIQLIHYIPTLGTFLENFTTPTLSVYLLIIITQVYIDLTQ